MSRTDWREELGKLVIEDEPKKEVEEEVKEDRPRDETGKFAKKEDEPEVSEESPEEETGEADEEVVPVEEPVEKIDPPAHFTAEEKKYFETLPVDQQKWISSSVKRMSSEADKLVQKRNQELTNYQRRVQAFDEVLSPYKQQFALQGVDETSVVKQLMAAYDYLQKDPAGAIRWLSQSYGVDLNQVTQPVDPAYQQVVNQINQVNQGFQQLQQTLRSEKEQQMLDMVNRFADEKDTQGNLKHPHFEAVVDDMMKLIQGKIVPGNDLNLAYDRAVLLHPELSQPPKVPEKVEVKPDPIKEAAEKAARAKKAAAGVKSGAGSPKTEAAKTRRQEIEELVNAQTRS